MNLKRNLDTVIYDQIIDSLILGEYKMGEQILLDTFAEKYGVSRTPIVQAVKLLANDGILEVLKNGRVRVPVYTPTQIAQLCDVRILLELYALDEMFKYSETPEFEKICEELNTLAVSGLKSTEAGDKLGFNKSDLEFHRLLVKESSNEFLTDLYKRTQGRFVVANYLSIPWENRDFTEAAHAHLNLMEALSKRDFLTCKKLLTEHIQSVSHIVQ
ncbi:MAG: GntR family transcriptional regulator [Lachnospiraceae bacterium]|nr:GntR family transcriptional regulator [Lachnospiraceae bacterium]